MMNNITQNQAKILAGYVATLRPDWGETGIMAALARNHQQAPAHILTIALINIAANPDARTPALLDHPGPHWDHANGIIHQTKPKPPQPATTNDPPCPDHPPHHLSNCPQCKPHKTPMPETIYTQIKNTLKGQNP